MPAIPKGRFAEFSLIFSDFGSETGAIRTASPANGSGNQRISPRSAVFPVIFRVLRFGEVSAWSIQGPSRTNSLGRDRYMVVFAERSERLNFDRECVPSLGSPQASFDNCRDRPNLSTIRYPYRLSKALKRDLHFSIKTRIQSSLRADARHSCSTRSQYSSTAKRRSLRFEPFPGFIRTISI